MLLFEYLVNDIEKDFLPRHTVYKGNDIIYLVF